MTIDDHVWILISEKLSGEISAAGLQELEVLKREDPELNKQVQMLENIFKTRHDQDSPDRKAAFLRHLQRMLQENIILPDDTACFANCPPF
jgi:transmembrane sensor